MAIQDQGQNQLRELAAIVRRRIWQIVLPGAVTLSIGYAVSTLMPKRYSAQTSIELREVPLAVTGYKFDEKTIQREVANNPWQIVQFERVRRVLAKLEWPEYTSLTPIEQGEFVADTIRKDIAVNLQGGPSRNQQGPSLITIAYTNTDPKRAEQFLNRLRDAYTTEVLERYRHDAKHSLGQLFARMQLAREEAAKRDQEAAEVRRESGVSLTQQAPGGGRQRDEDPVYTRLAQTETQLAQARVDLDVATAALAVRKEQAANEPAEVPETYVSGGTDYTTEFELIAKEIESLEEQRLGKTRIHSDSIRADKRIGELLQRRARLEGLISDPTALQTLVPNKRRLDLMADIGQREYEISEKEALIERLEAEVGTLRDKNFALGDVYRRLQALDREAGAAQEAYMNAAQAYDRQKAFVDQINEGFTSPFEVTEYARAPLKPSSAAAFVVIAVGAIAGLALGLLWVIVAEFGRNGFRGVSDAARGLAVPVLGVVNRITTAGQRRTERARRIVLAASSLALVAGILWTTWAYKNRPHVLGPELAGALDSLREALR